MIDGDSTVVAPGQAPADATAQRWRVAVTSGPDAGKDVVVDRARVTAGRHASNDLVLSDAQVSGVHFELVRGEGGVSLRDLGSTNGTWIGGCRVIEVRLAPGVPWSVGGDLLVLERPSEPPAALPHRTSFGGLAGRSAEMRELFAYLEKVAPRDLSVLVEGETGTGKEEAARAIHAASPRAEGPFVVLDCASVPATLVGSVLFGHEKGAFTGADAQRPGVFESASGGTILLDEIGEMPLDLQGRLLRVLERREVARIGSHRPIPVDVRVISATNRDLRREIERGAFRDDVYFRLAQVRIALPPLRARPEDVPLLATRFLQEVCGRNGEPVPAISPDAIEWMTTHPWPGNVRELRNAMERAAALAEGGVLTRAVVVSEGISPRTQEILVDPAVPFKDAKSRVVERFERAYLAAVLRRAGGNVSKASRAAGLARNHFRDLLKEHGLWERAGAEEEDA